MLRGMADAPVPAKRRGGGETDKSKDSCKRDMERVQLNAEDVMGMQTRGIQRHSDDPR